MGRDKRRAKYFGKQTADCSVGDDVCSRDTLLPPGIIRVSEEAIAATRLIDHEFAATVNTDDPITVAAFDFDGTCISGSSPKKLVNQLMKRNLFTPYKLFRIGLWGAAYKLNLPSDPEGVRVRVFSVFRGMSAIRVNDFLCRFYHKFVAKMYRSDADAEMIAHLEAGHVVVVVSASFEPIIAAAMVEHPIQFALASRMRIDKNGDYTDEVEGLPTEGPDKIVVLRQFLNDYFGEGKWKLGWAYGDHYSDYTLLEAAANPCAVTPDSKLRELAKERGWEILDWDK